ncbi:MAG: tryptophan--tRNA ligase [Bacillota bacterium]|nr:tryptophan--tRNA ligase [Bacillota bacterium]
MKTLFTGIQPTNDLTVGNYLSLKNFLKKQDDLKSLFCVVNLHAITLNHDPQTLREKVDRLFALYMAAGVDIEKSILFVQSDVPEHTELSWLLTCNSYMGELNRMTQFKDKTAKINKGDQVSIPTGIYMYPILMAADILLYDTHYVPVGADQKQHVELARNIAERFNHKYGEIFVVPEPVIAKVDEGSKILALDDPSKKMSKSNENKFSKIGVNYTADEIKASISKAVTDSDGVVRYAPEEKPGVSNLMVIYSKFSGLNISEVEKKFQGVGYGVFKKELTAVIADELGELQKKVNKIIASGEISRLRAGGAAAAREIAVPVLERAKRAMGIL